MYRFRYSFKSKEVADYWLIYTPPNQNEDYYLQKLWNALDSSLKLPENVTLIGDFNITLDT